jgi:hypothetical protein
MYDHVNIVMLLANVLWILFTYKIDNNTLGPLILNMQNNA